MPKLKKINFELIQRDAYLEPYAVMDAARKHHEELQEATIMLAWRERLKPDKEGHLVLGKCVKASDLQRELVDIDFVILLNRDIWDDCDFTDKQRLALMDHELSHACPQVDDEGVKRDQRGRVVWRTRKHDIEEFQAIVARHGCYKADLQRFAEALTKKRKAPLFAATEEQATVQVTQ